MAKWMNRLQVTWLLASAGKRTTMHKIMEHLHDALTVNPRRYSGGSLAGDEKDIIEHVRQQTCRSNMNNITRTSAYLDLYGRCPEVHWALLAHVVSRNGGWGMTDLKGEWFVRAAGWRHAENFFRFLERANWLIFGDAFAQLLLYEEGRKRSRNLSYLLTQFGVSRFMKPIWDDFWITRDSSLLTRALIVNEQNYIESRVLQNPEYGGRVIPTLPFQMQSLLNLSKLLIPYSHNSQVIVAGTSMRHFASLNDRIQTGKKLYLTLFRDSRIHNMIVDWMKRSPHTGTRADYWPEWFTDQQPADWRQQRYVPRFLDEKRQRLKIYSPCLKDAWPDVQHALPETGDWFRDLSCVSHLVNQAQEPASNNITKEYIESMRTMERLILMKENAETEM